MSEPTICPECHLPLSPDAPEGLCPQCLIKLAMDAKSKAHSGGNSTDDESGKVLDQANTAVISKSGLKILDEPIEKGH